MIPARGVPPNGPGEFGKNPESLPTNRGRARCCLDHLPIVDVIPIVCVRMRTYDQRGIAAAIRIMTTTHFSQCNDVAFSASRAGVRWEVLPIGTEGFNSMPSE